MWLASQWSVREELGWSESLLWEELNLSAIQRNFKALGTFAHQIIHQNKPHFAPAIPRTLRHLLGHFQRIRRQVRRIDLCIRARALTRRVPQLAEFSGLPD